MSGEHDGVSFDHQEKIPSTGRGEDEEKDVDAEGRTGARTRANRGTPGTGARSVSGKAALIAPASFFRSSGEATMRVALPMPVPGRRGLCGS